MDKNWYKNKMLGNFAEFIAKEHFNKCNLIIEPFGKEYMLRHLINYNEKNKMSFSSRQNHKYLRNLPDYTISGTSQSYNTLHLIEVKYKESIHNWEKIQTYLYWDYRRRIFSPRFMYHICQKFNLPFDIWDSNYLNDRKPEDFNIIDSIIKEYISIIKGNKTDREKFINQVITFYIVTKKPKYQESPFLTVYRKDFMPYVYLNATSDPGFIGAVSKEVFEIFGEHSKKFNSVYIDYIHDFIKKFN